MTFLIQSLHHLAQRQNTTSNSADWQHLNRLLLKTRTLLHRLFSIIRARIQVISLGLAGAGVAGFAVLFFWPVQHNYAFAGENCFPSPVWLPEIMTTQTDGSYKLTQQPLITLAGYPLYSHTACVKPVKTIEPDSTSSLALQPFGNSLLAKKLTIKSPALPSATAHIKQDGLIAPKLPLTFSLDQPDTTFSYQLSANDQSVMCAVLDTEIRCGLDQLKLKQSKSYRFVLAQMYNDTKTNTVFEQQLKTVEPVTVKSASVKNGSTVYDQLQKLTITFSKSLDSVDHIQLEAVSGKKRSDTDITTKIEGQKLTVKFNQPLPRQTDFILTIDSASATDLGYLPDPYKLKFKTSGGPQVKNINISSFGVLQNPVITLAFDAPVSKQNIGHYVSLENQDGIIAASVFADNRIVTIKPTNALPWCRAFAVHINDDLKNTYGVSGDSGWKYDSRTLCYKTTSIGSSVNGRSILAYTFGHGNERIVYVGATHGDEISSKYTLDSFIASLDANIASIPTNRQIIVIPSVNPDGVASGNRTNAHNVDLNRNFPADDWKKDVIMPSGKLNKGGGGSEPLSEPETKALANYILAQNPILVMNYHAIGSLVIANESGSSRNLANTYGNLTGYASLGNSQIGNTFSHDTTGALTDWLHDKYTIPAILVELSSYGYNEFSSHSAAMWQMVKH